MIKPSTGNMYNFVTHTWNPVKGKCGYGCFYCYVNKWKRNNNPLHVDESCFRDDLGKGNFFFICSGCDLFHPNVPDEWINRVLQYMRQYQDSKYLLHTKNPGRVLELAQKGFVWPGDTTLCVTIESNRWFEEMGEASEPEARFDILSRISGKRMITVEPVMDFDVTEFAEQILNCRPVQVNIGADSCGNALIEPSAVKLQELIERLRPHTKIHLKKNLKRLLPEHELYGDLKTRPNV
jgi:DNA repair photolyase